MCHQGTLDRGNQQATAAGAAAAGGEDSRSGGAAGGPQVCDATLLVHVPTISHKSLLDLLC